jgi:hypothetical protein
MSANRRHRWARRSLWSAAACCIAVAVLAASFATGAHSQSTRTPESSAGEVTTFDSPPPPEPIVAPMPNVALSPSSVRLRGYVSGGAGTTYYFEYGANDCANNPCASVPASHDGSLSGDDPAQVEQLATGLTPGATYHYRLVATNESGTAQSSDATFRTFVSFAASSCSNAAVREEQGSTQLAECRGYEWVTAIPEAERNSANVLLSTQRSQAAVDGAAFLFSSTTGTAGVQSLPGGADYMAVRAPQSGHWSVHALMPPQPTVSFFDLLGGAQPRYVGDLAPNLSRGIFFAATPVNEEGENVRSEPNLYLRDDLLDPAGGSYRLLTDAETPQASTDMHPIFAGASADFSHVLFESERVLTAEAAGLVEGLKLYEWVEGVVRLVGVLPASEGGAATISKAGQGAAKHFTAHTISSDGSRVVFTAPPYDEQASGGRLYLRDDRGTADPTDDTTLEVNASEKTNGTGPGGRDSGGVQPATFWDASSDLDQIFFTSSEALTNDAPEDLADGSQLYRFEPDKPNGARLTLLSADSNPADGSVAAIDGVIGASRDGSYAYFVGSNQLVAGGPTSNRPRIFVWHDGVLNEVGAINSGTELERIANDAQEVTWSRLTPDGRHLVFESEGTEELIGYDHGNACPELTSAGCQEVYVYEADPSGGAGGLQCASCDPTERKPTADADFEVVPVGLVFGRGHLNRPLTNDGRLVFFTTAQRLVAVDHNESADAYAYDARSGAVHLLSGGRPGIRSYFLEASRDGGSAFLATHDRLLAGDVNDNVDVYDARVDGGTSEARPQPPCISQDACRPATNTPPETSVPESARFGAPVRSRKRRKPHRRGGKRTKKSWPTTHHARRGGRRG